MMGFAEAVDSLWIPHFLLSFSKIPMHGQSHRVNCVKHRYGLMAVTFHGFPIVGLQSLLHLESVSLAFQAEASYDDQHDGDE